MEKKRKIPQWYKRLLKKQKVKSGEGTPDSDISSSEIEEEDSGDSDDDSSEESDSPHCWVCKTPLPIDMAFREFVDTDLKRDEEDFKCGGSICIECFTKTPEFYVKHYDLGFSNHESPVEIAFLCNKCKDPVESDSANYMTSFNKICGACDGSICNKCKLEIGGRDYEWIPCDECIQLSCKNIIEKVCGPNLFCFCLA
jgi:hypothetical protein